MTVYKRGISKNTVFTATNRFLSDVMGLDDLYN